MTEETARIIEIFPSIQGEGVYVGRRHLFVRFWNCNLACRYCDTDYEGPYEEYSEGRLLSAVRRFVEAHGPFHAVSLTGGEPLLWARFLRAWLPGLKALGQASYLETNGTRPEALEELLPWMDIVAMDFKPPSATGDRPVWEENEEFLRIAHRAGREVFVKIVVTAQTDEAELGRAFDGVASVSRRIPLVLQPVTPCGPVRDRPSIGVEGKPSEDQLARWARQASARLRDVRVLAQMHPALGVR